MKNLFCFLMLTIALFACNKDDEVDPLSHNQKSLLLSKLEQLSSPDADADILYRNFTALSKESMEHSNGEIVKSMTHYKNNILLIEASAGNEAILYNFILYDKRCKGEIDVLASLLLWDYADKHYPEVTNELRSINRVLNNADLIKLLLSK